MTLPRRLSRRVSVFFFAATICSPSLGQVPNRDPDRPRPTPLTRHEMKQYLEDMKVREPRIPLPELTDAEREQLGEGVNSYESRLRFHYLGGGDSWRGSGSRSSRPPGARREQDPEMTLDYDFKVELFWIVSRTNNCQYCLGHQESKLLGAGLSEDRIAALDGDWSEFTAAEQAAYAFARKYTLQPHLLADEDIRAVKQHYTDMQILEMMLSMAWNNSINRWKEGVGVPQSPDEGGYSRRFSTSPTAEDAALPRGSYLTPTSPRYADRITRVAPIAFAASGVPLRETVCQRPNLESRDAVEAALELVRNREPRLPLLDPQTTRTRLSLGKEAKEPAHWMRLMAQFPSDGVNRARDMIESERNQDLSPLLKAQLSWIVARQDRAWYALGDAKQRLLSQGLSKDDVYRLDGDWSSFMPQEKALFQLAKQLGASPVVLTDAEVANAVELAGPATVVQAIHYVTQRAAFDRITEAAGLPLEI